MGHELAGFGRAVRGRRIDGLIFGRMWGGGSVSYSDPDSAADYGAGYVSDYDRDGRSAQQDGFARLTAAQLAAARGALDGEAVPLARAGFTVEGFTGLGVSYAGARQRRSATSGVANGADRPTAYAYYAGRRRLGGDVWLGAAGAGAAGRQLRRPDRICTRSATRWG